MRTFEHDYAALVHAVLVGGATKVGRNGETRSMHGLQLSVDTSHKVFPLLEGRKMFYSGVLGELAAFFRGAKHVRTFEQFGCNYWSKWADEDGTLRLDYGNAWLAELYDLVDNIKADPYGRRHIINGWVAKNIPSLSLPCCHYSYQFLVTPSGALDMIWIQRSVDMMVGLPSDIILAATWLIALAHDTGHTPGKIVMQFGDCHIYAEHYEQAAIYIARVFEDQFTQTGPTYTYTPKGSNFYQFEPSWLTIHNYHPHPAIKLEVKA